MTVSINIPAELEERHAANVRASGLSLDEYLRTMLEHEAESGRGAAKPLKTSYGVLAQHGPAPSLEEINRNRAEMFRNFECLPGES